LHDILQKAGLITAAGGNIGVALCSLVDDMKSGVIAVEVSSFQLQTVETFRPHICAVLNITPDHLDRHKTIEEYTRTKSNIFRQQNPDDYLVLNYEDERVRAFKNEARSTVVYFSVERVLEEGLFVENDAIYAAWNGRKEALVPLPEILLRGKHNLENILGAVAMAYMGGVSAEAIRQSLRTFKGVRHRLEEVALHNGILYINDSKGTNPDSTIKALASFKQPIVLIAGGRAKGGDYSTVAGLIANQVKELVLVGEARELLKSAVMDYSYRNIHEVDDFASAVYKASELAEPGDVVLLSPACASWDMFESYEHRGDLFCELVEGIVKGNKHQG
jgi:UDP-N-acetylmuramoylalanine--D-glutamate ligase